MLSCPVILCNSVLLCDLWKPTSLVWELVIWIDLSISRCTNKHRRASGMRSSTSRPSGTHLIDSLVKLIKNYRSHPAILKFPNRRFYSNELEPHADPAITHSLLRSDVLSKRDFPIVFHGIRGKDMREASSPSFFNPEEASLVKNYVQRLKEDQRLRLSTV